MRDEGKGGKRAAWAMYSGMIRARTGTAQTLYLRPAACLAMPDSNLGVGLRALPPPPIRDALVPQTQFHMLCTPIAPRLYDQRCPR
ncbi:hypothetical protein CALCODRAFT_148498 [Calocera cornea HHB12733]|uniref:Uncharacterized protein n=1 Tax=Calocera cornea HHB12733 TaxID=1353952 RepID=A0A165CPS5_9BASI|nr:hypothetical protein CALCODRAFT_148498 [Calocera cornea HHB12733]